MVLTGWNPFAYWLLQLWLMFLWHWVVRSHPEGISFMCQLTLLSWLPWNPFCKVQKSSLLYALCSKSLLSRNKLKSPGDGILKRIFELPLLWVTKFWSFRNSSNTRKGYVIFKFTKRGNELKKKKKKETEKLSTTKKKTFRSGNGDIVGCSDSGTPGEGAWKGSFHWSLVLCQALKHPCHTNDLNESGGQ